MISVSRVHGFICKFNFLKYIILIVASIYVKILWILSEITHRTKFYTGQACQTGGPSATYNSWLALAAKLSEQPKYKFLT